jgi:hypothetical protein
MLHWNGTAWHRVAVADPGRSAVLENVGLSSGGNVWAVGYFEGTNTSGYFKRNLALHAGSG